MGYIEHLYTVWLENGLASAVISFLVVTILGRYVLMASALVVAESLKVGLAIVEKLTNFNDQRQYKKIAKRKQDQQEQEKKAMEHEKRVNQVVWGNQEAKKPAKN